MERDWKYLQSIKKELLEELSRRICIEIRRVLDTTGVSENEKRLKIYDIVHDRDLIVAQCFDDWKRSALYERCRALQKHGLLKPEHGSNFSPEMQSALAPLGGFESSPKKF